MCCVVGCVCVCVQCAGGEGGTGTVAQGGLRVSRGKACGVWRSFRIARLSRGRTRATKECCGAGAVGQRRREINLQFNYTSGRRGVLMTLRMIERCAVDRLPSGLINRWQSRGVCLILPRESFGGPSPQLALPCITLPPHQPSPNPHPTPTHPALP